MDNLASLTDISKIDNQLSRAIVDGDYNKCKEILERDNVSVDRIYYAFEECYIHKQSLDIAKLVSNHHSFDPNEKCIITFENDANILESLYKMYECRNFTIPRKRIIDNDIVKKEFEHIKPFIHLVVFHPKMLESTIMDVIANCHSKIFGNYLEQCLINKKAASYWLFCCQTRVFPFYPDLSKKIAEMIIE